MSKHKRFRRVKVGNRGYHAGKRQAMFWAHERAEKKTASGAANTDGGKAEQITSLGSASSLHENGGFVKCQL